MEEKQINPFLDQRIENYCQTYLSEETDNLKSLNRQTHLNFVRPHMISGNWQGTFLKLISNMIKPKYILEIGTFSGYSTLCLADGLQEEGIIHTIEKEQEYEEFLQNLFQSNNLSDKVKLHIGKAIDILPTLNEEFDIIFIDADKANYPLYYDICVGKLRKGGIMIADNILWYGKVALNPMPQDKETLAINLFNKKITEDKMMENLIIPLRDGLMVGRKL
jgi:predicted O-methyltransferase YrrM